MLSFRGIETILDNNQKGQKKSKSDCANTPIWIGFAHIAPTHTSSTLECNLKHHPHAQVIKNAQSQTKLCYYSKMNL